MGKQFELAALLMLLIVGLATHELVQGKSGNTVCAAIGIIEPNCLGEPLPSILDDGRRLIRPREFRKQDEGHSPPYQPR